MADAVKFKFLDKPLTASNWWNSSRFRRPAAEMTVEAQ
jgi:hypothetical protein